MKARELDRESARQQAREIEGRLLSMYGIRVDAETADYVTRQLRQTARALPQFPVIGGAAKTGAPVRLLIDPAALRPTVS